MFGMQWRSYPRPYGREEQVMCLRRPHPYGNGVFAYWAHWAWYR